MKGFKRKPELIVIAGPNGSGKTTVTTQFLHHEWWAGVVYINPDQVAKDIFGDWNSQEAVLNAAKYCSEWRERCLKDRISFVFETVFSAEDKIDFQFSSLNWLRPSQSNSQLKSISHSKFPIHHYAL